jgi:hypothetical protein
LGNFFMFEVISVLGILGNSALDPASATQLWVVCVT